MKEQVPLFSVIVLFGRGALEPCLSSLLKQTEQNFEIIGVIGSEIGKVNDSRVKLLVVSDPNPAKRRNQAVRASRGKILAFIDDDAIAPKDWLSRAKEILEKAQEIVGLGGANLGQEKMSWREQLVDMILRDKYFGSGSGAYQEGGIPHLAKPGEIHFSNFFIRREIWELVGGVNEKIGYGGEDSELVYRVRKKLGKNFWYFPQVFVWHKRRALGKEFFWRNLKFRHQNGRMLWFYPEMYLWNKALWLGLALLIIWSVFLFIFPSWKMIIFSFGIYFSYFLFHSLFFLKAKKWLCVIAPVVYFLHHLVYLLGLGSGLLDGIFKGRKKLRQLLGRENLQ